MFHKITFNSAFNFFAQGAMTILFGAFMLIVASVVGYNILDAYEARERVESLGPVHEGTLHILHTRDYTRLRVYGEPRMCIAVQQDGVKDYWGERYTPIIGENNRPNPEFCNKIFSTYLNKWKQYTPPDKLSIPEKVFYIALIGSIVVIGMYFLLGGIVDMIVALLVPGLVPYVRWLKVIVLLPVFFLVCIYASSIASYVPGYWQVPSKEVVEIVPVFIAKDGTFYYAPKNTMDWTNQRVGKKVSIEHH